MFWNPFYLYTTYFEEDFFKEELMSCYPDISNF